MRTMPIPTFLSALALSALLAGCAGSPPARYYTLQAPAQATPDAHSAGYQIEVATVSVPQQADQPQIMLRVDGGALTPLYSDRWSAPLSDEIGAALSDTLTRTLGAIDVQTLRPAEGAPVWRIQVDVQRFDMIAGGPARLDATWRVRPIKVPGGVARVCRTIVQVPADDGTGVPALVRAQQQAVELLGTTIASAIQAGGARATAANAQVQLRDCT